MLVVNGPGFGREATGVTVVKSALSPVPPRPVGRSSSTFEDVLLRPSRLSFRQPTLRIHYEHEVLATSDPDCLVGTGTSVP